MHHGRRGGPSAGSTAAFRRRARHSGSSASWPGHAHAGLFACHCWSGVLAYMLLSLPSAFVPEEDQGAVLMTRSRCPPGANVARTQAVVKQVDELFPHPGEGCGPDVSSPSSASASPAAAQNSAIGFVRLKDYDAAQGQVALGQRGGGPRFRRYFRHQVGDAQFFTLPRRPSGARHVERLRHVSGGYRQ